MSKSFWSKFFALSLICFLCGSGAPAAEKYAEDMQPQRELSTEAKEEAEQLKKQIAAEKERVRKFVEPIDAIKEKLKAPSAEVSKIGRSAGAVAKILDDIKEAKKISKDQEKQIKEVGKNVSNKYVDAALDLAKIYGQDKYSQKAADTADKKMREIYKASTAKLENTIGKLEEQKNEAEYKLRVESTTLTGARAKLLALYGYKVEGMGIVMFASESSSGGDGDAMNWLDGEIKYIELLNKLGYNDIATNYLKKVESSNNPFTGKPFSTNLRNYLGKASAKLMQQRALAAKDMKEKLLAMQETLAMFTDVQKRLTPQTSIHYDASNDLISAYFRFAEELAEDATARALIVGSQFKPAAPVLAKAAAGNSKNKKPASAPAAPAVLKKEDLAALNEAALNDLALTTAVAYFQQGMQLAVPLCEQMAEIFEEMLDNYSTAAEDENKADIKKWESILEKFAPFKLRLQHSIEGAYAAWPLLYPAGSPARTELAKAAGEYVKNFLDEYKSIWPDDKQIYGYMMRIFATIPDPLFAKDDNGKPIPHFIDITADEKKGMSAAERREELAKLERYPWASDKIKRMFDNEIVGEKTKGKKVPQAWVQSSRVRGLYCYAQACVEIARSHFQMADAAGADQKDALLKHAEELHKTAVEALTDVAKTNSAYVGPVDDATCNNSLARIAAPYYLYLSSRALQQNDKEKASDYAQMIMDAAAMLVGSADPSAKNLGSDVLAWAQDFGKRNELSVGGSDPDSMRLPLVVSNAEKFFKDGLTAERAHKDDEAAANYSASRDFYILGIEKARRLTDKHARDNFFPKALYSLAAISIKLQDYTTAYVASQLLVQEFRNDFENPLLNYPPEEFPGVKMYFPFALKNLRAAAALRMRERGSLLDRRDYIDALLLCVRYSNSGDDYVTLINAFKSMQQYTDAVRFIDKVSPDNDYYRLAQLMGAGIYLELAKVKTAENSKIAEQLNPPEDEDGKTAAPALTEEAKKELQEQFSRNETEIKNARVSAGKYATKFITLHKEAAAKWEADAKSGAEAPSEYVKNIREQERGEILKALFIPIQVAHASGQWSEVQSLVPAYLEQLEKQTGAEEEEKQLYRENALWIAFDAGQKSINYDTVALDEGAKKLKELEAATEALAKIDKDNKFGAKVAGIMGNRWNRLAVRADKAGDEAKDKEFRKNSVDWLEKAESRIYERLAGGVSMITTLADQMLWERAIAVGDKVISYWGEAQFTPNSLLSNGKERSDIKGMSAGVKAALDSVIPAAEVVSAAKESDDALAACLNKIIRTADCKKNLEAYSKAIAAALPKADSEFAETLKQAQEIVDSFKAPSESIGKLLANRKHLLKVSVDRETMNILNRTMVEAAFPELYRRPLSEIIPSPALFYKKFEVPAYSSDAGRKKAAVFIAMVDPNFSTLDARAVFGESYPAKRDGGLLLEWKNKVKDMEDGPEKARLQRYISAVETPLVISLYGELGSRGRITKRNFTRARNTINTILEYDKFNPSSDFNGKFPLKEKLESLSKALAFQNTLLFAKKSYAKAMVEHGDYEKAEKYVAELCAMFPTDWALSLELAHVYAAMAKYENKDGKLIERPYTKGDANSSATLYLRAIAQAMAVNRFSAPGSAAWWESRLMMIKAQVDSMEARKKAGGEMLGLIEGVEVSFTNPATGQPTKQKFDVKPMDDYEDKNSVGDMVQKYGMGRSLAVSLQRDLLSVDSGITDEIKAELEEYVKRLNKLGYSATIEKTAVAAPAAAEASSANVKKADTAESKDAGAADKQNTGAAAEEAKAGAEKTEAK